MDPATGTHHVGTGHSSSDDAARAGVEALAGALGGRLPRTGDLVIVFANVAYDAATLMRTIEEAAEPATVIGASARRSFSTEVPGDHAITVLYLPAGQLSIGVAWAERAEDDLYTAARDAAQEAKDRAGVVHPNAVLMLLSNHTGVQREVVRGAYEVTGARVPLFGGSAMPDIVDDRSWISADGALIGSGVVAVWLNSPTPLGVAVDHGWSPNSKPLLVTSARDNIILELDGRPAAEVYLEVRGRPYNADHEGLFGWEATDLPFGLPTLGGGYEVRHIRDRTPEGGLEMFGYVHDQAVLRVMTGHHEQLVHGARGAVRTATRQLDHEPRGVIVFSCSARWILLGDQVDDERAAMAQELGGVAAAGFFTSAEYARTTGSAGFHTGSVAVLAL